MYATFIMHSQPIPLSVKNTRPENNTLWTLSSTNTKSGAGDEFLLLFCWAEACIKSISFSQTPVGVQATAKQTHINNTTVST